MISFLFWFPMKAMSAMETLLYFAACYADWGADQVIELDVTCYVRFF